MSGTGPDRLLIVDDAPYNVHLVETILAQEGYETTFAHTGTTALSLAKTERFDLILLDVVMPDIDGFEVCKALRKDPRTRDIPVLFLTARSDTESVVSGFNVGAMDYVTKPVNEAELMARVKTHLELYHGREELKKINIRLQNEIDERIRAENRYRRMYENAVQGMFQCNLSGEILRLNPSFARILGYDSEKEVLELGSSMGESLYFELGDRETMLEALKRKSILTDYELKMRRKDGGVAWLLVHARLTERSDAEPLVEGIAVDNTAGKLAAEELRRSEKTFRYLAVHDSLTGLYNTRYLYQSLTAMIEGDRDGRFSLIFMDIDNFKKVVDTYGHLNGSRAVAEVARTIGESLSEPAWAVAYAGDEFVIVLPDFDKEAAKKKAEEIRVRMHETEYLSSRGFSVALRASFGISSFPDDAADMSELLTRADQAMFDAKARGKDVVGDCRDADLRSW